MPRVDREPAVRSIRPLDHRERRVDGVHHDVVRHELVDDLRVGVLRGVGAELGVRLHDPRQHAGRAGEIADLDVVGRQHLRRLEQQRARQVGGAAALVARFEEPVPQELELEVLQAVVIEELSHLMEVARLEHVLQVGVPKPDTAEADASRLLAAIAQVEEAPFPAEVNLDRAGDGPIEAQEVGATHSPENLTHAESIGE